MALLHPLSRSPFCVASYLDVCVVWIVYLQTALPHLEQIQPSRALQHSTELWANNLRATQTGTQIHTYAHAFCHASKGIHTSSPGSLSHSQVHALRV